MKLNRCALRHQSEAHVRARQPAFPGWLSRFAMVAALSAAVSSAALAQTASISGTVTDAVSAPIVAAQVSIPGTRLATATDANGRFHLTGLPDPVGTAVTLMARRIGYANT
ncbi:MAG: carboxypeptidase regulatory-like domain-containing protein, partial [Gemmatimonadaceae bacterium]|nr:carboxypeptidase regulatory-like domain-containing protein [Gemmatimonadaceae bacterium]